MYLRHRRGLCSKQGEVLRTKFIQMSRLCWQQPHSVNKTTQLACISSSAESFPAKTINHIHILTLWLWSHLEFLWLRRGVIFTNPPSCGIPLIPPPKFFLEVPCSQNDNVGHVATGVCVSIVYDKMLFFHNRNNRFAIVIIKQQHCLWKKKRLYCSLM